MRPEASVFRESMSNIERVENLRQIIGKTKTDFEVLAKVHGAVNYAREASFAIEALNNNYFLASIAMADQDSLKRAVINVAAIGLSLNPVQKLAYLIPRDKKVCLDVSYRGYIQLATEVGAILWAVAELVYEKDDYVHQGVGIPPMHKYSPFSKDRGPLVGCYVLAKAPNGEHFLTTMTIDEIYDIRDRSQSWRAFEKDSSKTSPWNTDEGEMIKKTVIRRAYKSWPLTDVRDRERFEKAIDVGQAVDPVAIGPVTIAQDDKQGESLLIIKSNLAILGRAESDFIEYLTKLFKRDIKKLDDLTAVEAAQAIAMLKQFVSAKSKMKELPKEGAA